MNFARTILRRCCDNSESRQHGVAVLQVEHFKTKIHQFLFKILPKFEGQIITAAQLLAYVETRGFKARVQAKVIEEIGQIFAGKPPLKSDFDYCCTALSKEAETDKIVGGLNEAVQALTHGDIVRAKDILSELPTRASKLSLDSNRRRSARTMHKLKPADTSDLMRIGFKRIDEITGGGRPGELWLWAAYTGEMKSTSLIAIAHFLMLHGKNVLFASFEMSDEEVMHRLLNQHATHLGHSLRHEWIRLGNFPSEVDKKLYRAAVKDFDTNPAYGDIQIWQPPLGGTIQDVAREVEMCCSKIDCPVLVLDYIQKLQPIHFERDHRIALNHTLDMAKRIAMEARNRKGIFVVSGYQTSTAGRKEAEKNGYYDLWALSESIGAAQVSNVVAWSLVTPSLRQHKEMKVGLAKARNSGIEDSIHILPVDPSVGLIGREPIQNADDEIDDLAGVVGFEE